ncbi:beta-lactamase-like protein 2 [Cladorrhinum sp. PSN259]|nr:beta-lactamase-like protein 2 [Cladorrhinum sp. PSN259]
MRPLPVLLRIYHRHRSSPQPPQSFLLPVTLSKMANPNLPPIQEIAHVSPSLIRILAGNGGKFTLQGTNTYLIGTGPNRILIDTGEGKSSWISALKRTLASENASIQHALITHWHGDHTGGIPDLLSAFPNTKVYKNQTTNHPDHDSSLIKYEQISDGQVFAVPGATLKAFHTPGHTTDHMVLHWQEQDALFTGDNVLGHGTAVFEDLSTYLSSLNKMRTLFKGVAYPGHGLEIADGPAKIVEYLRHRQLREDQVVQRLKSVPPPPSSSSSSSSQREGRQVNSNGGNASSSSWTLMELVRSIYQDVPETLHPAAAGGLLQILHKLQREEKVVVVDDGGEEERWRLVVGSGRESAL